MSYKTIRFQRQQLYEEVWSKPMTTLSKEYGLSDVGLRKICKRLNIPLPPKGYHLQKYKGRNKPPLPPPKDGYTEHVTHLYEPEPALGTEVSQAVEVPEIAFEEQPENRIVVPQTLTNPHSLITEAKKHLKQARPDRYGRVSSGWKRGPDISVFPQSIDRALLVMNCLFKSLLKRGYTVTVDEQKRATYVRVLNEDVAIKLEERSRQVRHVLTPAEVREQKTGGWRYYPTFDYLPTGEFSLAINRGYGSGKICQDDKKGKLEEKLNTFIVSLIKEALQIKDARVQRQREEELYRLRERRRSDMNELIRKEKQRIEVLKAQVGAWHESQQLREFVLAVRAANPELEPEGKLAKWLVWASLQADRLDPLKNSPPSVLDYDGRGWW